MLAFTIVSHQDFYFARFPYLEVVIHWLNRKLYI